MEVNIQFANEGQRSFFYAKTRNQVFSGGFNNGKTYIGCLKVIQLLLTFSNYRVVIARQKYTDLKKTTMQTFFKIMPAELVETHNEQDGITILKNGSVIFWLHLDKVDENTLRGLEANTVLVDQAEETEEKVFDVLDSRVGRWDGVIIPKELLQQYPNWPKHPISGNHIAPSYHMLLVNPDTQYHYIYRKGHPESIERIDSWFWVDGEWDANLGSQETYEAALKRDPEWVEKYIKGLWGRSSAQIHYLPSSGILEPIAELLEAIQNYGNLFRVLDHGESAPTCCLWFASLWNCFICYREYYVPNKVISYHRQAISDLSAKEQYSGSYADPSIFKKASQKDGGFWTVAAEYLTSDIDAPPLSWIAADNNEFATRNRINELLSTSTVYKHPTTKETPAIGLYFIKATVDYSYGCKESIKQLGSQRRKSLGTIDGKTYYSDDRDDNIVDHAYDCIRYFVAMHGSMPVKVRKAPRRNSFAYFNALLKRDTALQAGSVN